MNSIIEKEKTIPVAGEFDLCVVGGSATGVFAAVSAARLGLKTAIVEGNGFFGGVATAGLVNIWHSLYNTEGNRPIIAGLTLEVIERLKKRHAVTGSVNYVLNTAELIIELDCLIVTAGVRPFLHAHFSSPVMEGDKVNAVIIEDKTGRRAIKAKYYIDATGDGDVLARAGLPCDKWDDIQPPTTCAMIQGIHELWKQNKDFSLGKTVFDPRYRDMIPDGFLWAANCAGLPNISMVAGTRVPGADCSDADILTKAEIEGRRQVRVICDILKNVEQGGDQVGLVALPSYIGVRETRHAKCIHMLKDNELSNGMSFPDAIANGTYPVDVHHSDKPGITLRYLNGEEKYCLPNGETVAGRWRPPVEKDPTFYQIPYRSLVPTGSRNLLTAGRLIGVERNAYGAIRVMVNCNQTGEAAGTAAYLARQANADVNQVDAKQLRQIMSRQGSIII